jgi:2'-5' RNA ligase
VTRLFSAILPPGPVLDELASRLGEPGSGELRWIPRERWHLTLGFFGDDDDETRRTKWLRRRLAGRTAPRLRLAGAGSFPGAFWAGVQTTDRVALDKLAQAAGAGRRGYTPHLTLARWRGPAPRLPELLTGYTGEWFTPVEVALLRSDPGSHGPVYRLVERVPLAGA